VVVGVELVVALVLREFGAEVAAGAIGADVAAGALGGEAAPLGGAASAPLAVRTERAAVIASDLGRRLMVDPFTQRIAPPSASAQH
jgi:Zn-dependent protease